MIVCPEPPAARAGQDVFAAGGNAVDAAVAAAFCQGVTNPLLCGVGGTALFHYYDAATRRGVVLNAEVAIGSRPVPSAWREEYVGRAETVGRYIIRSEANQVGHQSVMIPGFVRGCWTAFNRFGSGHLTWAELLAPAIRLAREGFEVYPYIAAFWRDGVGGDAGDARPGYPGMVTKLTATPDARRLYFKADGSPFRAGDRLVQPEYADTLERLALAGGDDFYTGELARRILEAFERHAGLFSAADLADYAVRDEAPLRARYRKFDVTSTPPPSSGAQLLQMLQILERFDVKALEHDSTAYVDLFARVQRATFSDNVRLKGIQAADGPALAAEVLDGERTDYWVDRILRGERIVVRGGAVDPGTTHLSAIDDQGNVVSFTHSIGSLAGSGVVVPGLGFLFNNFLGHFNPLHGQPDSIEPGKRLGGGLPSIVLRDGSPYLAIGAPGGSRLITSVAQVVVNALDFDMPMEQAVSVPRFHSEEEQLVFVEPAFSETIVAELESLGNTVERSTYMSRVQAVRATENGERKAGADPRGGGGVGRWP